MVPVSEESKAAMLSACAHELPTKPKRQGIKLDAYTEYDSDYGAVKVSLNPKTAHALVLLLTENLTAFESAEYLVNGIEEALEEHKDFTDMNEPGLTDGNTDGR